MNKLESLLTNPLNGLKQNDEVARIQERFDGLAKILLEDYGVKCGEETFRFAEIEFYYYKKVESIDNWDKEWNKETYPRNKRATELFYHYSGIDICFECNYQEIAKEDEYGEFGGILIRSLFHGNEILAGPLFCAIAMLNACNNEIPRVVKLKQSEEVKYDKEDIQKRRRYGIQSDKDEKTMPFELCYFVASIKGEKIDWEKVSKRISWDKKGKRFKFVTRNYKNVRGL